MIKKLIFTLVLAFTLASLAIPAMPVFAVTPPAPGGGQATQEDTAPGTLQGPGFMFDLRSITHEDVQEEKWIRGGLNFIFERIITIIAATIGSAAVLMITVGGFAILASAGRQQWIDTGKSFIFKSLIGLAVTLGAYILIQTIQILIKSIYA